MVSYHSAAHKIGFFSLRNPFSDKIAIGASDLSDSFTKLSQNIVRVNALGEHFNFISQHLKESQCIMGQHRLRLYQIQK